MNIKHTWCNFERIVMTSEKINCINSTATEVMITPQAKESQIFIQAMNCKSLQFISVDADLSTLTLMNFT